MPWQEVSEAEWEQEHREAKFTQTSLYLFVFAL